LASASGVQQLALAAYTPKNLAAQARAAGYDQQADVKRVEQLAAQRALSDSWMIHQADIKAPALDKLEPYARTVFENETANHEAQPKVHVRHLLIRSGAEAGRTDEQALALASELLARAKAGEDFSSLAKQYSDDRKSAEQGGELAAFARGKMVPEFEQAAFALKKPGDLSAPVKTHFGYHLIELLERAIPGKPKFEDETVALKLALTGAIKDQLLPMDEVTIFGLNYFKEHYPEKLAERFKQMKIEEEAPVIIMDMTRALGFRDDYDRFYSLFVKEVRDGKLGNYTLDTLEDFDGDD